MPGMRAAIHARRVGRVSDLCVGVRQSCTCHRSVRIHDSKTAVADAGVSQLNAGKKMSNIYDGAVFRRFDTTLAVHRPDGTPQIV